MEPVVEQSDDEMVESSVVDAAAKLVELSVGYPMMDYDDIAKRTISNAWKLLDKKVAEALYPTVVIEDALDDSKFGG